MLQSVQATNYGHSVSITLQSQIAHYISSESQHLMDLTRAKALDHLTLTCQLWQKFQVESVRTDIL